MATVALLFAWLLVAIGVLLVLALATPLSINLRASLDGAPRWTLNLGFLGGFGPKVSITERTFADRAVPKKPRTRTSKQFRIKDPLRLLSPASRLLSDTFRVLRLRMVALDVRFGFSDPADTGQVFGLLTPVLYGIADKPKTRLRIVPDFDRTIFSGHAEMDLAVIPARLLPPLLRFGVAAWRGSR